MFVQFGPHMGVQLRKKKAGAAAPPAKRRKRAETKSEPEVIPAEGEWRASRGDPVLCREHEYAVLRERTEAFLSYDAGAVVYVTGVPGSGKTHTITSVLESVGMPFAHVNCAELGQKSLVFRAISERIGCAMAENTLQALRAHFHTCNRHHIIFVDEVDLLRTRTESLLYNLFEMPFIANARVLLVVAANTLGALSTKIESRIGKDRLEFRPYTSADLSRILRCRTDGKCGGAPPKAGDGKPLELISKRVASSTGDIRKALELADRGRAASLLEMDAIIKETAVPLLNRFVGVLGYYQKLALFLNSDHSKNLTEWFRDLRGFCKIRCVPPPDFIQFRDCVDELVRVGIFSTSGISVGSSYHREELERAMKGDPVFSSFLTQ